MSCGDPHETPCEEVLEKVYLYLDGEAEAHDHDHIRIHLDECSPCLRKYGLDRKSTRLNSSHTEQSRMPSSA